jgi:hypothetical protein
VEIENWRGVLRKRVSELVLEAIEWHEIDSLQERLMMMMQNCILFPLHYPAGDLSLNFEVALPEVDVENRVKIAAWYPTYVYGGTSFS